MSDPAIRAALEAASEATTTHVAAAATRCLCGELCHNRRCTCTDDAAAAAVAAFLRALPSHIAGNVAMFTPRELAGAVERAAREPE